MVLHLSKHSSADLAGNCGQQKVTSSCIHVWVQQQCIRLYPHVMSLSQNEIYQFWWVYIYIYIYIQRKNGYFWPIKNPCFVRIEHMATYIFSSSVYLEYVERSHKQLHFYQLQDLKIILFFLILCFMYTG